MREAYIVGGVRTAIGNYGGALSSVRPDDLAAHVLSELLKRTPSLAPAAIGDVILGCANQAGEDNRNVARMASLLAGLPVSVPGQTVNRLCASGLAAIVDAARAVKLGEMEVVIAGGVESMSRAPWVMAKPTAAFSRAPEVFDSTLGWRFINQKLKAQHGVDTMGETAENVATEFQISREEQDQFALSSQARATKAQSSGVFSKEIAPMQIELGRGKTANIAEDEFIRPETTLETLGKLKPAFRSGGTVTAGNSSGINDGACAVLIASDSACKRFGLTPLARIVSSAVAGVEPRVMGVGPAPAIESLMQRLSMSLDKVDLIELNEAFAAQVIGVCRKLGVSPLDPRLNPNGGAIALGHPLGMSGARLALTAALQINSGTYQRALCSMCIGVGQGMAALLERP
jgi:acetyl-CoA acyltransferase